MSAMGELNEFLARTLNRLETWLDRKAAGFLEAAAADEPAVDDALDTIEQLDFQTPCGSGPHGYLIRSALQCPYPAVVAVVVDSFDGADIHIHDMWCARCYAMYRNALHAFGFTETQVNEHLHVEAIQGTKHD